MSDYIITSSSTADLSQEHFDELGVPYNSFSFTMDGKTYPDDLGKSIKFDDFYQMIRDGKQPVTSQPNFEDYYTFFKPFLEEGKDIVHLNLSSGISGSINSANAAAEELREEFPDRKITIIDSLAASSGYGLLVDEAVNQKNKGLSYDELVDWIEDNKLNLHHWFFSTDLTSYKRGGRISPTAATFGNLLNICPVLNVSDKGELIPRKKPRGKKAAMKKIVQEMKKHARNGTDYDGKVYLCQSDSLEDAEQLASMIKEEFPNIDGDIEINNIGTVIGSHTGPGTIAAFFWGDKRVD